MAIQGHKHTITIKVSMELMEQLENKKRKDPDFNRTEWFEELAWEALCNPKKKTNSALTI